jgi:endo-1,4-beta-D-glucanase Y
MSWALPTNGMKSNRAGPATDGDMDMAYALLLAADQWTDPTYKTEALSIIDGMEAKYVVTKTDSTYFPRFNLGDPAFCRSYSYPTANDGACPSGQFSASQGTELLPFVSRPSDYMVDHYRAFFNANGHAIWSSLETGTINVMNKVRNATTGLVPDFLVGDTPVPSKTGTFDEAVCYDCFDYNACRVPLRQAVAVAHYGVAGSSDIANKMVSWAKTAPGFDGGLAAGYKLDGTVEAGINYGDSAFTSPMTAAGIVSSAHQAWVDAGWTYMKGATQNDYYGDSLNLMSMLLVSGNWWIPGGTCTPACSGKVCGTDGCGGTCGTCTGGQTCNGSGQCVTACTPNCAGKTCGDDGCGGSCGTCAAGSVCTSGSCVCTPNCTGKTCGSDGCGGSCGTCTTGLTCNAAGSCVSSITTDVNPTKDAYVRGGSYATANYGTAPDLIVRQNTSNTSATRNSWLSFSLAGFSNITAAKLRVYVKTVGTENTNTIPADVYSASASDSWVETTINYNNAPATTAKIGSVNIVTASAGTWVEYDVTNYVKAETDGVATFTLMTTTNSNRTLTLSSREDTNKPILRITTGGSCTPTTCAALGKNCGSVSDGCGGTLSCGSCTSPQTCGGAGTPNVCGCAPATCASLGKNCGSVADGCGGTLSCGSCTSPLTCGGGGDRQRRRHGLQDLPGRNAGRYVDGTDLYGHGPGHQHQL